MIINADIKQIYDFEKKYGVLFSDFKMNRKLEYYFCLIDIIRYFIVIAIVTSLYKCPCT